jgi:hypothetical protein
MQIPRFSHLSRIYPAKLDVTNKRFAAMVPTLLELAGRRGGNAMARLFFCAAQVLLAVTFSIPGCAKHRNTLPPPEPAEDSAASRIGTFAPEIAGADIDGTFFKLSDYRGQVVLLDFWGNW